MKDATLVVMAAGMGSRFGGLKQMEPVTGDGRAILDYSVYDAKKAGFNKVVFIIKKEIEEDFREIVGKRIEKMIDVEYVLQSMEHCPEGRKKPLGTGHAIYCCKDVVKTPFAVINADDYYGCNAFREIRKQLDKAEGLDTCMVGYLLENTTTENGTVARGVCEVVDGHLVNITERTKIANDLRYTEDGGNTWTQLPKGTIVSMNLWGFTPAVFGEIEKDFNDFLKTADLNTAEFYIPTVVDNLIKRGKATVTVLKNTDKWYGMTYKEDKDEVTAAITELVKSGAYDGINDADVLMMAKQFATDSKPVSAEPFGEGHINGTFLVTTESGRKYTLQKINTNVFKKPVEVMENITLVLDYIRDMAAKEGKDPETSCLRVIFTKDGKKLINDERGAFRMYAFIEGVTYQTVEKPEHFYCAAKAFGHFQKLLSDFPAEKLYETIENFHNTPWRFDNLEKAVKEDKLGRLAEVQADVDFAMARREEAAQVVKAIADGSMPLRVTHNDTKLNNVLLDENGEALCILDLDTVMPGSMLYDFGDSIRFGATHAAEDEHDLSKVDVDLELFEQYVKGFLSEVGDTIAPKEKELLAFSAKLLTLECGIRFLTDYLEGDTYFKIHYPDQNLRRTRTQLKLVADMEKKMDEMNRIVAKY